MFFVPIRRDAESIMCVANEGNSRDVQHVIVRCDWREDVLRRLRDETERLPHAVGVHPTGGRERDAFALTLKTVACRSRPQLLDLVADGAVRQCRSSAARVTLFNRAADSKARNAGRVVNLS